MEKRSIFGAVAGCGVSWHPKTAISVSRRTNR